METRDGISYNPRSTRFSSVFADFGSYREGPRAEFGSGKRQGAGDKEVERRLVVSVLTFFFWSGCRHEELISIPLAQVRLRPGTVLSTSDPSMKNEALRHKGTVYLGAIPGPEVPLDRIAGLKRSSWGEFRFLSRDEGIVIHRPGVPDTAPCVITPPGGYRMFWASGRGGERAIYTAVSADGYKWTGIEKASVPASPEDSEAPGGLVVGDPAVLVVNGTWFLYYTVSGENGRGGRIFCVCSQDGASWVPALEEKSGRPIPVISPRGTPKSRGVGNPSACYRNEVFLLWYTDTEPGREGLWLAVSTDGVHFRNHRKVAGTASNPDVKFCPELDCFVMAEGRENDDRITIRISPDGLSWPSSQEAVPLAVGPPETVHHTPGIAADELGKIKAATHVFYAGGIATPDSLGRSTWEIESSWVEISKRKE